MSNISDKERTADYLIAKHALDRYMYWLGLRNKGQRHLGSVSVNDKLDKHERVHLALAQKYGTSYLFAELLLVIKGEPVPAICE